MRTIGVSCMMICLIIGIWNHDWTVIFVASLMNVMFCLLGAEIEDKE